MPENWTSAGSPRNIEAAPDQSGQTAYLSLKPVLILLVLAMIWGANMAVIKIGYREVAPIFSAGIRSLIAALGLYIWLKIKGEPVFSFPRAALHGLMLGIGFGVEFSLVYFGLKLTFASRVYVLLYTAPFWAALGAHMFLQGDRLNLSRVGGLILAFIGVCILFLKGLGVFSFQALLGDLMVLFAGGLWGGTTVYMKKFLAGRASAMQSLFYMVAFSIPILFGLSLAFESPLIHDLSSVGILSLLFQGVIVAFLSYLVWCELIQRYPVSLLHAFSFFTPVFGVFISGILILHEPMHLSLIASLVLVSIGMVLVNRH